MVSPRHYGVRPDTPGVDLWRWEMRRAKDECKPRMTWERLSDLTGGLTIDTLKGIFNRKTRKPSLNEVGLIADALEVPRQMAYEYLGEIRDPIAVQTFQLEAEAAVRQLRAERNAVGWETARIAAAITQSGRWALSVFPVFEGPSAHALIHVADRLQVVPVDPSDVTEREIADRLLDDKSILEVFKTVRLDKTPFDGRPEFPISEAFTLPLDLTKPDRKEAAKTLRRRVARYSLLHFSKDHLPPEHAADSVQLNVGSQGPQALLVLSLVQLAWPTDTSYLLSRALGWGMRGSREFRRTHFGPVTAERDKNTPFLANRQRTQALTEFLARVPLERYVHHHWGTPVVPLDGGEEEPHPLLAVDLDRHPGLPFIVLLSESDALLRRHTETKSERFDYETLLRWRDQLREATGALQRQHRGLVVDVGMPRGITANTANDVRRRAFWKRTVSVTNRILRELQAGPTAARLGRQRDDEDLIRLGVAWPDETPRRK